MYLFKMQPMFFDLHNWQTTDAFTISPESGSAGYWNDGNKEWWQPFSSYSQASVVKRGQHVYYSAQSNNRDDPFFNYIGLDVSSSDASGNMAWDMGKGNNSWIRGRCLHDYDCINYISPGNTKRSAPFTITMYPKKMGRAYDVDLFLQDNSTIYFILQGVVGSVSVSLFEEDSENLIRTIAVPQTETTPWLPMQNGSRRISKDACTAVDPEIPGLMRDLVLIPMPEYKTSVGKITISITGDIGGNSFAFPSVKTIAVAAVYHIGNTIGKNLNVGAIDYSRISYDEWGKMSLVAGKKAKTMEAVVALSGYWAAHEEKVLRLLESCRATPTIFIGVNSLPIETFTSSLPYILGLVKNVRINEENIKYRELSVQIDGMPIDYNP